MPRKPSGRPTGRPKKQIDQRMFEAMCKIQCTLEEICDILGTTDDTLNRWCRETYGTTFSEVFKEKRGLGKMSLRRTQWDLAKKSPAMAIFLGKNYLGQSDKVEQTVTHEVEDLSPLAEMLRMTADESNKDD